MATTYDARWPISAPVDPTERVITRYGGEIMAGGPLDGDDNPFTTSGAETAVVREFFHAEGSFTLTDARLLGSGTRGTSRLGAIDLRTGGQLLFSLDLDEVFSVTVLQPPTQPIQLDLGNHLSIVRLWVSAGAKGSLTGKSNVAKHDVATQIVRAACARRLSDRSLDAVERRRVEDVAAGRWATESGNLVAHIRHPDDVSDWVTSGLDELPDPPPPQPPPAPAKTIGRTSIVRPQQVSAAPSPQLPRPQPIAVPPAGWYDAPGELGQLRYWDGSAWTDHRAAR